MRADRIKVPQQRHSPLAVALLQIAQNVLDEQFRSSVRIQRRRREILRARHRRRFPVHRRARAKAQRLASVPRHRLAQRQRAPNVILIVQQRLRHALPHRLEPGEVDHRAHRPARREHVLQRLGVAAIALAKRQPRGAPLADDRAHARDRLGARIVKVIDRHDGRAGEQELHARVRADVPGAAGDEDADVVHRARDRVTRVEMRLAKFG